MRMRDGSRGSRDGVVCWSIGVVLVLAFLVPSLGGTQEELGSNVPSDEDLLAQRAIELQRGFVVEVPVPGTVLRPVQRVPRQRFGVVGPLPLQLSDLEALVYPGSTRAERQAVLEGLTFFTLAHTPEEGAGPVANQPFCQGCHLSSNEAVRGAGLVVNHVSNVSRAARSTPTNFRFTSGNATTGGRAADHLDAINDTGQTAAFTIFGDFSPSSNLFDRLDGSMNPVTRLAQQFGG